jgi:hypothetical protein
VKLKWGTARMKKLIFVLFLNVSFCFSWVAWASPNKLYEYLSPVPGSDYHLPETTIVVRYGEEIDRDTLDENRFQVVGVNSGKHDGDLILSDDRKTLIFKPNQPFPYGERIEVSIKEGIASLSGITYSSVNFYFTTASERPVAVTRTKESIENLVEKASPSPSFTLEKSRNLRALNYVTLPGDFPNISLDVPADDTGAGYLFISPLTFGNDTAGVYSLIIDNRGEPVYYQKLRAMDFKKLSNGNLVYYQTSFPDCFYYMLNSSYQVVDIIKPGNGYTCIDGHDLQLLPNGHYLFFIYFNRSGIDLVPFGGIPNAIVTELVIQEIDWGGNVVFEWRSWDPGNFSYGDAADFISLSSTNPIDYIHTNAVELDTDGNILISSRHLNEITKINRSTGAIIWRLGGKQNQFNFTTVLPLPENGLNFFCQHDVRRLVDNRISLFDNHNINGGLPVYSRGLEYELDEINKIADLKKEIRNAPDTVSFAMGNTQRLPNGNTLIGWGSSNSPLLTEFKPDGSKSIEMSINFPLMNYRVFRFPWHGYPTWAPTLAIQNMGADTKLSFSWNGATETAQYEIFGGMTPKPEKLIASTPKSNFEDSLLLTGDDARYCFYRIMPVDKPGRRTIYSESVANPQCGFLRFLPLITNQLDQLVN